MQVYYYKTIESGFHTVLKVDLAEYKHRLIVPEDGILAYGDECEFLILIDDSVSLDMARTMVEHHTYQAEFDLDDVAMELVLNRARLLNDAAAEVARLGVDRAGLADEMLDKRKSEARDAFLQLSHMIQLASQE